MTREEIFEELRKAMVELFELEPERVTLDSRLIDDLQLDSIDAVDLVVKMQELCGQRIEQEAFRSVRTVSDIVNLVHRRLS